jgi:hypothetical protein
MFRKIIQKKKSILGIFLLSTWVIFSLSFILFKDSITEAAVSGVSKPEVVIPHPLDETADDKEIKRVTELLDYWTTFYLEKKNIPYVWGGSDPDKVIWDVKKKAWRSGFDCSGGMHNIFHSKAGIGVIRTTSQKMYLGAWPGYHVKNWKDVQFPELIFFSFKKTRFAGHVVIARKLNKSPRSVIFAESSEKADRFKETKMVPGDFHDEHFQGILVVDLLGKPKKIKD